MTKEKKIENIFREYYTPLCNYANKYCRDWYLSQDLVQSTFLKIWNNWDNFKDDTSQKSYLFRAVKNTLIEHINKHNKESITKDNFAALNKSVINELDSYIIRSEVIKSLDRLKPKMRKVFVLNKLEGLSYSEIAQFLKISERTVEDNMARTLKALRKDLVKNKNLL